MKIAGLLCSLFLAVSSLGAADDLQANFANPPDSTQPRCYWYWMDGHITKEGLTKDLEAMRRVGIGEAYIGVISGQTDMPATGDAPAALSDEWWSSIEHAVREGGRIGVDIGFFNSPGWSQSGGPWVKPNQAMRHVVLPEIKVTGPKRFSGPLPTPTGEFQDIGVFAFPAPAGEGLLAKETVRTPTSVLLEMPEPFTARSVTVYPVDKINVNAELQASDDGKEYRTVKSFKIDRHNLAINVGPVPLSPVVVAFPATTAKFFRLNFSADCSVGEVQLSSAARVESFPEKSLAKVFQDPLPPFDFYTWSPQAEPEDEGLTVNPKAVVNLSKQLSPDGTLTWDVPEGDWVILRAAMVPTGTQNTPAPPEATGLEVDKMSRTALKTHFDAYVGELLRRMPAAERTAFKHVVADSYETGPQNWTDGFAADFSKRYGYDPMPWLPALTGRIVGNADRSNRFLWDLRRFVADRVAEDYVGGLRDLCNENGLKMWLENYGHWGFPSEFLKYGGSCDEVSGEFWVDGDLGSIELRDAASAAHIYGKPVVYAEAFTGGPAFVNTPRDFKARGDWAFCEGISQFVLHVNIHQPWDDKLPGINAWFGTEFNRNNTWFEYSKPWIDYLRRCSVLLQAGKPVADVAYFISEDAPKMAGERKPALPAGYDFDYINADVIMNRLEVKDGRFVLPEGVSYRLLVLPQSGTMRPALLKKIQELVQAGGAVLGPKPDRSPSLENYPACDAEVKQMADALWDGKQVMTGDDLAQTLTQLQAPEDVVCPEGVLWKHRSDGDTDIYFVSNQQPKERRETLSFRVTGRTPELWSADTGTIATAIDFKEENGRTSLTLDFDPAGSVFVVFKKGVPTPAIPKPELQQVAEINGPWKVTFPTKEVTFEKLIPWTEHSDPDIKYFSGTATYRAQFNLAHVEGLTVLDLGTVDEMARVRVNGQDLGVLWKFPYKVDISKAVKQGENTLEVDVVNTWLNALLGDGLKPESERKLFVSSKSWKDDKPLTSSGLLGKVTVHAETQPHVPAAK